MPSGRRFVGGRLHFGRGIWADVGCMLRRSRAACRPTPPWYSTCFTRTYVRLVTSSRSGIPTPAFSIATGSIRVGLRPARESAPAAHRSYTARISPNRASSFAIEPQRGQRQTPICGFLPEPRRTSPVGPSHDKRYPARRWFSLWCIPEARLLPCQSPSCDDPEAGVPTPGVGIHLRRGRGGENESSQDS